MFSYGSEELAHHRQRELLDTATYIRNARRARERARARRLTRMVRVARLVHLGRRQPAVVPVPPKPADVLRASATVPADGDASPPNLPVDDDFPLAS